MIDNGLVSFLDGGQGFHVYLPAKATPEQVAKVLQAVCPRVMTSSLSIGTVAADFIACVKPSCRAELKYYSPGYNNQGFNYLVQNASGDRIRVKVYDAKSKTLFDNFLPEFVKWAESYIGIEDIAKKVVRFAYNGGTNPGKVRTVKVKEVTGTLSQFTIKGYDLECDDLTDGAFRNYTSDKISGDIVVIN